MTRFEIALKKPIPFEDCLVVGRKLIILKEWHDKRGFITLEKSPRAAHCKGCRRIIPEKTLRYTVKTQVPYQRFFLTECYHRSCLSDSVKKFIKKKEESLNNVPYSNGRSVQKIRVGQ